MTDTFTHTCPNCGGPLVFNPKTQTFICDYCLSSFTEDDVSIFEKKQQEAHLDAQVQSEWTDTTESRQKQRSQEEKAEEKEPSTTSFSSEETMEFFNCSNCGAQIVTDATTAATYCYYCHSPVVLSGRISGKFLPDKVLPFSIEKKEAIEKFLNWTQKKWFVPKDFFDEKQIAKMTGVYFPYWMVDAKVSGKLTALGTTIRVWRIGDIEYTETKRYDVQRQGKISFKELLKNALSKNVQQKMVEIVQPFLLEQAVPFKSQYLAGFQAEKRDIEYESLKDTLETELKGYTEALLRDTAVGYTTLTKSQISMSIHDEASHYVLLPIWLVTYRSKENSKKIYYYAMNGQTGKVSGVLPVSYKRLGVLSFLIFFFTLILFLIGGWFI